MWVGATRFIRRCGHELTLGKWVRKTRDDNTAGPCLGRRGARVLPAHRRLDGADPGVRPPRRAGRRAQPDHAGAGARVEGDFFPQPSWIVDAIHERIVPLPGHVSASNQTESEIAQRARLGV